MFFDLIRSPVGDLRLTSDGTALTGLSWTPDPEPVGPDWRRDAGPFRPLRDQLDEYFEGERTSFDLPMKPMGTPFQLRVWEELGRIPFGRTISYAELARRVGRPGASRAVGGANGCNRIALVIPCHRVIASDGSLAGFGGGLERKRWLICHEARVAGVPLDPEIEAETPVRSSTRVVAFGRRVDAAR